MSQENLETVRELHNAFNRGDYGAALSALSEDVEWHAPVGVSIGAEVHRGRDVVQREFARWLEAWDSYRFEATEMLDHGDHVVVCGIQVVRGRGSGVEVDLPTFNVYTLHNGKITSMHPFDDRDEALEAAGLRE